MTSLAPKYNRWNN